MTCGDGVRLFSPTASWVQRFNAATLQSAGGARLLEQGSARGGKEMSFTSSTESRTTTGLRFPIAAWIFHETGQTKPDDFYFDRAFDPARNC